MVKLTWLMNPRIPHHMVVMVLRASIISESKVSTMVLCLRCLPHCTAVRTKNCPKSTPAIKVATMKNTMVLHAPVIIWNWSSLPCQLCSTRYTTIQINNCSKSTSGIKVATMKNMEDSLGAISVTQRKPIRGITKLTLFTLSKDEWNTKEDYGKSLKNALDILQFAKRHLSGWSNVK